MSLNIKKSLLYQELIKNKKSLSKLSAEIGCSKITIIKYCKKYGIYEKIKDNRKRKNVEDFSNKKFGKLLVLERGKNDCHGKTRWVCLCDCGRKKLINSASLKRNLSKSCGMCCVGNFKGYEDISGSFFRRMVNNAHQRGLEFNITSKDIWDLYLQQNKKCAISGVPIKFYRNYDKTTLQTASIDRIDVNKGYTKDNIQIVHKRINFLRGSLTVKELIYLCKLVYDNNKYFADSILDKHIDDIGNGKGYN